MRTSPDNPGLGFGCAPQQCGGGPSIGGIMLGAIESEALGACDGASDGLALGAVAVSPTLLARRVCVLCEWGLVVQGACVCAI